MSDTIVALSSPPPHSLGGYESGDAQFQRDLARAIIRLSGSQAVHCAEQVFCATPSLSEQIFCVTDVATTKRIWRRVSGEVCWKEHILPASAYCMPAPHSYTREDMIELHVPSLSWVVSELLDRLLAAGARAAQPGEFTRRAFESGRISLTQAEAVGALINSLTADEARARAARLQTRSSALCRDLRAEIEELLAQIEFGLDFSSEEAGALSTEEIFERLDHLCRRAEKLSDKSDAALDFDDSARLNMGMPRIALIGPTNAGKSSLFNALLGRSAAIVSSVAHTTRDFIEAPLALSADSVSVKALLVDTAGCGAEISTSACKRQWLRETAWNATLNLLRGADMLLLVMDQSISIEAQNGLSELQTALRQIKPASVALLWTKADLTQVVNESAQRDFAKVCGLDTSISFSVSTINNYGIDLLRKFLAAQAIAINARVKCASFAVAVAAREAVARAIAALLRARDGFQTGHGEDIVAVELREATHACWQIEGIQLRHDAITEAMLDKIFSKFCVGK